MKIDGDRLADTISDNIGTWRFILSLAAFLGSWFILNSLPFFFHWDGYPYFFVNLLMSAMAAFSTSIICMAQRSQAARAARKEAEDEKHKEAILTAMLRMASAQEAAIEHLAALVEALIEKEAPATQTGAGASAA